MLAQPSHNPIVKNRLLLYVLLWLCYLCVSILFISDHQADFRSHTTDQTARSHVLASQSLSGLPLIFEPNLGQSNADIDYLARGRGYSLFLSGAEATLRLQRNEKQPAATLQMRLTGAEPQSLLHGNSLLPGKSNYLLGDDPAQWHTGIPQYADVICEQIYPGIDLRYYGNKGVLEYDFLIAPGADPNGIRMLFEGLENAEIDSCGDLHIGDEQGEVILKAPFAYQDLPDNRVAVACTFKEIDHGLYAFDLGDYDHEQTLVIDPELVYSTYLGGDNADTGYGIDVDQDGNVYVVGTSSSLDFPTLNSIYPMSTAPDVVVLMMNATGSQLLYSTYIGGNGYDSGVGIKVDNNGNVFITGKTRSTNFPTVAPFQAQFADVDCYSCGDAFVTAIRPGGTGLLYSSYLGGTEEDYPTDLAIDTLGNTYVTGYTKAKYVDGNYINGFPITPGAYKQTFGWLESRCFFVTSISITGTLNYSTFLTPTGNDQISLDVNDTGIAWILRSLEYVPDLDSHQFTVVKLNASGTALLDSIAINAFQFTGFAIAVDRDENIYVAGETHSDQQSTITSNAYQKTFAGGGNDGIFWKLSPEGTVLYASYLGGTGLTDFINDISLDSESKMYLVGNTNSTDFPIKNPVQPDLSGLSDAFVACVDPTENGEASLIYSTFLGGMENELGIGIAVDNRSNAYVTGWTFSSDFPVKNPYQGQFNGVTDIIIARIGAAPPFLLYDHVMIGGAPVFQQVLPPVSQQVLLQFLLPTPAGNNLDFLFQGRSTDGRVAVRVLNTRLTGASPAPLTLQVQVFDPQLNLVPAFQMHNLGEGNDGVQFDVLQDGVYTIRVTALPESTGPFPAPFQIHLAGDVGHPRKLINGIPAVARATRQEILFNHTVPRPQVLLGVNAGAAQAGTGPRDKVSGVEWILLTCDSKERCDIRALDSAQSLH